MELDVVSVISSVDAEESGRGDEVETVDFLLSEVDGLEEPEELVEVIMVF